MKISEEPAAPARSRTDWIVYGVTAVLSAAFVIWGAANHRGLNSATRTALGWLLANVGWLFVLAATGFVVFSLWLALSRYGRIPLGREGDEPEFRTVSWVAMMFSAGMGIGLMFFGVAEPLTHYVKPPPGTDPSQSEPGDRDRDGHHDVPLDAAPVVDLRRPRPRDRVRPLPPRPQPADQRGVRPAARPPPHRAPRRRLIDILALFATLFGSAASLGIGALQIRTGMQEAGWIDSLGTSVLVLIIVVLTICFILSAVSGIARGIQWLSNTNMVLAAFLAFFVFVAARRCSSWSCCPPRSASTSRTSARWRPGRAPRAASR